MGKPYHHGDLKRALINETLAMIDANEVHLIGFRELSRRLHVSRGAPYRHFDDVEQLLATVVMDGYEKFIQILNRVIQTTEVDDQEKFRQLGIAYVNFALEHPAYYRLMFDGRFFDNSKYPDIKRLARHAFDSLAATVAASRKSSVTDPKVNEAARLAWAAVHGISKLFIDGQWQNMKHKKEFIRQSCSQLLLALV